jgi:hypothetical protein
MTARWERLAALTGVAAVALWIAGVLVLETVSPEDEKSPESLLAYFEDEGTTLLVGAFLFALGTAFFVWFLGSLRAAFLAGEGMPGRVTAIAFAGGIGKAVFDLGVMGGFVAGALGADENLTPEAAQAIFWMDDAFFIGAEFMGLVFMAASALLVFRTRVLPVWMGWLALVIAIGLLVVVIGWVFLLFGLPLWVLLASLLLWRAAPEPARAAPET